MKLLWITECILETIKVDVRTDHFIDLFMIKQKDNEELHLKKKNSACVFLSTVFF